jgi:hypothetical protein
MSDVNNKDQEFFRRLQDFREEPPAELRAKIHEQIGEKKKKRRIVFWWMNAGPEFYFRAAAVLAGVALLSYVVFSNWKEDADRVLTSADSSSNVSIDTSSPHRVDRDDDMVTSAPVVASDVSAADDSLSSAPVNSTPRREKRKRARKSKTENLIPVQEIAVAPKDDQPLSPVSSFGGEENPFLPEESSVAMQKDECEDETVSYSQEVPADSIAMALEVINANSLTPLFPDSMNNAGKSPRSLRWELALAAGAGQWSNQYAGNNYTIDETSLNNAEQPVASFLGGVEVNACVGSRWVFTSGFSYSRQEEDWKFKQLVSSDGSAGTAFMYMDTTFGSLTTTNGVALTYSDPLAPGAVSSLNEVVVSDTMVRNSFSRLSVPVLIGYRLVQKEKWSLGIHTGIAYTNLLNATAMVYNIDGNIVENTQEDSPIYRRNAVDALFRLEAAYVLSGHWSLLLRPAGSLMLSSQYSDSYVAKRKSFRQSLEGGVVFRW